MRHVKTIRSSPFFASAFSIHLQLEQGSHLCQ